MFSRAVFHHIFLPVRSCADPVYNINFHATHALKVLVSFQLKRNDLQIKMQNYAIKFRK